MKITIHYDECDYPIDLDDPRGHAYLLDDMLDSFRPEQVPQIINQNLALFRGLCDIWNQRELAQRRAVESDPPLKNGDRVVIASQGYAERGDEGILEIQDVDGVDCWHVRFADGTALGVGETDVRRA